MKCITFSGVDGSGKSTQLQMLKEKLERENWNVVYFHTVQFSLANKIAHFFKGQKISEPGKEKAITKASFLSLIIRQKFLIIDILRFHFFLRKLKKENCDYLLSDRYFYDSVINIEYLASGRPLLFLSFISALIPRPHKAFYFDALPENIMSRVNPPEQGIEYLKTKQKLFKQKIASWDMYIIDGNEDKETIFRNISEKL